LYRDKYAGCCLQQSKISKSFGAGRTGTIFQLGNLQGAAARTVTRLRTVISATQKRFDWLTNATCHSNCQLAHQAGATCTNSRPRACGTGGVTHSISKLMQLASSSIRCRASAHDAHDRVAGRLPGLAAMLMKAAINRPPSPGSIQARIFPVDDIADGPSDHVNVTGTVRLIAYHSEVPMRPLPVSHA
jgi:hypothetical protein